jgi:uncharacterized membrane protein
VLHHVFYALFDSPDQARAALQDIKQLANDQPVNAVVHATPLEADKLTVAETSSYRRMMMGVIVGIVVGVLAVWLVLRPLGFVTGAEVPATLMAAVLGAIACGLGGVLMGASSPDPHLKRLAELMRRGKVIVTLDISGKTEEERALDIVRAHGATVEAHGSW